MYNDLLANLIFQKFKPRPRMTVSECADKYRYLSKMISAHPGKWKTSNVEYTRGIMDAISDPRYHTVVIRKPAQVSGTEIILNAILYYIIQDPASILWVLPTLSMAQDYSKTRLATMIRDCDILKDIFKDDFLKQKKSDDTILQKIYPSGRIVLVGSNSETDVSGKPIGKVFFDEIDRYGITKGGDPIELGIKRAQTFETQKKIILASTPSVVGTSKIDKWYELSDKRKLYVPCLKCGAANILRFGNVKFDKVNGKDDPRTSRYICPDCQEELSDNDINKMVKSCFWEATAESDGIAGFDIRYELVSPWVKMADTVKGFLKAKENPEYYREWVNLCLGESYNDANTELDADKIQSRAEEYDAVIPLAAGVVVGSADVQHDRIEAMTYAYGVNEEAWAIEVKIFYGDPSVQDFEDLANPWTQLDMFTQKIYEHESGNKIPISIFVVDHGHLNDQVAAFVKPRESRNIWAIKGSQFQSHPIINRPSRKNKHKITLFNVGVHAAKEVLMSRLVRKDIGPGYIHFPTRFDKEFFDQLTSEKKISRRSSKNRSIIIREFIKTRPRNEAWDLLVYNFIALRILSPDLPALVKHFQVDKVRSPVTVPKTGRTLRGKAKIW